MLITAEQLTRHDDVAKLNEAYGDVPHRHYLELKKIALEVSACEVVMVMRRICREMIIRVFRDKRFRERYSELSQYLDQSLSPEFKRRGVKIDDISEMGGSWADGNKGKFARFIPLFDSPQGIAHVITKGIRDPRGYYNPEGRLCHRQGLYKPLSCTCDELRDFCDLALGPPLDRDDPVFDFGMKFDIHPRGLGSVPSLEIVTECPDSCEPTSRQFANCVSGLIRSNCVLRRGPSELALPPKYTDTALSFKYQDIRNRLREELSRIGLARIAL